MYSDFYKLLEETRLIKNSLYYIFKYEYLTHSNRLEGSTFTTDSMQTLIEKNYVDGGHTLDDIRETINSFYTFDLVYDDLGKPLNLLMIKEYHSSLFHDTTLYKLGLSGVFKSHTSAIVGVDFDTCPPHLVEENLGKLIDWYNCIEKPSIDDVLNFHIIFERLHPFQDGNGRIGRLIYIKQLLECRLPLKIITDDFRKSYKSSLNNINDFLNYYNELDDFRDLYARLWRPSNEWESLDF